MDWYHLILSASFVFIAIILSHRQGLGLEKDLLIASLRAFFQLAAIGYILKAIFALEDWPYIIFLLLIMVYIAAYNASGKLNRYIPKKQSIGIAGIAISLALAVSLILLVSLTIIPFTAQYVIPISGMVIGNAMTAVGLTFNRLQGDLKANRLLILASLSLGANPAQASALAVKTSIKAGLIPTIDALKIVGIVQLPGMMTGMIIAGADPLEAVKYQIMIMFVLAGAVAIASMFAALIGHRLFFNEEYQLLDY